MSFKLATRCQSQRDFTPVSWTEYFDEAHDVHVSREASSDSFRVYLRNFRPPYAPSREFGDAKLDNVDMTENQFNKYSQYPTLVMLHGGGYSALTWAQFARHIEQECHCRLVAIDLRSHGDTKTDEDDKMDIETMVDDVVHVIHATHRLCGFPETPKIIMIGHSMGGAIAIKCSARCSESLTSLVGFVIIDVVEGTAKDALPIMMSVIKTRPNKFPSLQNAIEWSVRSGMAKNLDAARVSMPGNLLNMTTGHLSIHDIDGESNRFATVKKHKFHINIENILSPNNQRGATTLVPNLPLSPRVHLLRSNPDLLRGPPVSTSRLRDPPTNLSEQLIEEDSGDSTIANQTEKLDEAINSNDCYKRPPDVDTSGYCWRTDLAKTQPYWAGWFEGLSQMMLSAPVQGKFLLLAGIDRLDKTLTIGQMQGKFMMTVLPKCGHAVHEDSPEQVASAIGGFLVKNKFTTVNKLQKG